MQADRRRVTVMMLAAAALAPVGARAQELALLASADEAVARWEADPTTVFDAREVDVDDFLYLARPVVVFADSPRDPAFLEQIDSLARDVEQLVERDVLIVTDSDRDSGSELRRRLRPRGFMLALIGKDGQVTLRKPLPWTVREISRSIDKMPLRQQEMRSGA